jgi:hypothetical protein
VCLPGFAFAFVFCICVPEYAFVSKNAGVDESMIQTPD